MSNKENYQPRNFDAREKDARQLLADFELDKDAELFVDESARVEFLKSLDASDFLSLCQHINSRMRSAEPRDRKNAHEKGAYLPMLGTPGADEKRSAFEAGFDAISDYLHESSDSDHEKVRGAAMAAEALIIWVHPFNDGNGRTSRFLGKFIESGTTDTDQLIKETMNGNERLRMYRDSLRVDYYNTVKGLDIMWDEGELEEIERTTSMPVVEGVARSITRLLENKQYQDQVEADTERMRNSYEAAKARRSAA